jgi:hypothetical protein
MALHVDRHSELGDVYFARVNKAARVLLDMSSFFSFLDQRQRLRQFFQFVDFRSFFLLVSSPSFGNPLPPVTRLTPSILIQFCASRTPRR